MRRKIKYNPRRDYYAILGIETSASDEEIRLAYRRCVREVHPDLHPDQEGWATEQLQLINEAYDVLGETALRKEYDRLRWPHIPSQPKRVRHTYRSPFSAPTYDPNRPWWEQAAPRASRHRSAAEERNRGERSAISEQPPFWLQVSAWLRDHRLGALEPTWLTLVGLWRSPYAGLLSALSVVLALNVALIIYAFIAPQGGSVLDWFLSDNETSNAVSPMATSTPMPKQLYLECSDPDIQITKPDNHDVIGDTFSVSGTVKHRDRWNYIVEIGYVGEIFNSTRAPSEWVLVRTPEANQNIRETVEDGVLVEAVDLSDRPAGYYVIRLRVVPLNNSTLPPCDVVVQRAPH
jgi:hypothetical protein